MSTIFDGDFDLLPIRSTLDNGPVPAWPTDGDFALAVTAKEATDPHTMEGAAAVWFVEAVRWRRGNGGKPLNDGLADIARATARRLYEAQARDRVMAV